MKELPSKSLCKGVMPVFQSPLGLRKRNCRSAESFYSFIDLSFLKILCISIQFICLGCIIKGVTSCFSGVRIVLKANSKDGQALISPGMDCGLKPSIRGN